MKKLFLPLFMVFAAITGINTVEAATATTVGTTSTTKSLTITRNVENVSNPVSGKFTYSITADANNPEGFDASTLPANLVIQFNNVSPNASNVATQTGTLDLSSLSFNKVGNYKFIISEVSVTEANKNYPKDNTQYYAYVSVRNTTPANPDGNLTATLAAQVKNSDAGAKTDAIFTSSLDTTYIELSKRLTGDRADTDEYFAFTISIPGTTGDTYTVSGSHSTDGTNTVASSKYTVGTTTTLYLKGGQTITIGKNGNVNEIPVGVNYNITETGATEYQTYIDGSSTDNKVMSQKTTVGVPTFVDVNKKTSEEIAAETAFNTSNKTAYVNNREANVLAGLFVNYWPFIILIGLGVLGLIAIKKTSKNNEEY